MSSSMDLVTDSRVFCRGSLVAVASAIVYGGGLIPLGEGTMIKGVLAEASSISLFALFEKSDQMMWPL